MSMNEEEDDEITLRGGSSEDDNTAEASMQVSSVQLKVTQER